jgi:hypothetical protein
VEERDNGIGCGRKDGEIDERETSCFPKGHKLKWKYHAKLKKICIHLFFGECFYISIFPFHGIGQNHKNKISDYFHNIQSHNDIHSKTGHISFAAK